MSLRVAPSMVPSTTCPLPPTRLPPATQLPSQYSYLPEPVQEVTVAFTRSPVSRWTIRNTPPPTAPSPTSTTTAMPAMRSGFTTRGLSRPQGALHPGTVANAAAEPPLATVLGANRAGPGARYSPVGSSTWPPNAWRIAESSLSAYTASPRLENRANSAADSTGAGTPSSMAALTVHRPSP